MTVQVRSVVSIVAVMSVGVLFAADIQLKAYNANARNWTTASNWEGEVAPVNPDDTASLYVEACKDTRLVMNLDGNFAIDAVVTGPKNAYYMPTSRFSVRDFTGLNASGWPLAFGYNYAWQSVKRMVGCNFLGTTEVPSVVDKYYLAAFPHFGVPSRAASAANGTISRIAESSCISLLTRRRSTASVTLPNMRILP